MQKQQSALISALMDAGVPGDGAVLKLIETHISWILLTDEFAYKIKKPVNLGFVDFGTLEKRHYYCEEELRLNRRTAPELYLEVVEFGGSETAPRIHANDLPIEFAVKMQRFSAENEMSKKMAAESITAAQIRQFAIDLSDFHQQADAYRMDSTYANPPALAERALDNFEAIKQLINCARLLRRIKFLENWTRDSLQKLDANFFHRKQQGRVRECHGDLHLGNMVVLGQRVVAFDCLEFNVDFRRIDVASEIAFLQMDLLANSYTVHAREFLNAYLEASHDYDLIPLLRHYIVYRAMVRAKVACLQLEQQGGQVESDQTFNKYISLAENLAFNKTNGGIIITHGFSGCGKTWLCRRLVPKIDLVHIRSDVIRQNEESDSSLYADLNDNDPGAGQYSTMSRNDVYLAMAEFVQDIAKAGYTVLVDATFLKRSQRNRFADIAERLRVPFRVLDISAPLSELERRISDRLLKGNDASEADMSVLHYQLTQADALSDSEKEYTISFDNSDASTAKSVLNLANEIRLVAGQI